MNDNGQNSFERAGSTSNDDSTMTPFTATAPEHELPGTSPQLPTVPDHEASELNDDDETSIGDQENDEEDDAATEREDEDYFLRGLFGDQEMEQDGPRSRRAKATKATSNNEVGALARRHGRCMNELQERDPAAYEALRKHQKADLLVSALHKFSKDGEISPVWDEFGNFEPIPRDEREALTRGEKFLKECVAKADDRDVVQEGAPMTMNSVSDTTEQVVP